MVTKLWDVDVDTEISCVCDIIDAEPEECALECRECSRASGVVSSRKSVGVMLLPSRGDWEVSTHKIPSHAS